LNSLNPHTTPISAVGNINPVVVWRNTGIEGTVMKIPERRDEHKCINMQLSVFTSLDLDMASGMTPQTELI
jgi:hypothetical protein